MLSFQAGLLTYLQAGASCRQEGSVSHHGIPCTGLLTILMTKQLPFPRASDQNSMAEDTMSFMTNLEKSLTVISYWSHRLIGSHYQCGLWTSQGYKMWVSLMGLSHNSLFHSQPLGPVFCGFCQQYFHSYSHRKSHLFLHLTFFSMYLGNPSTSGHNDLPLSL